MLVFRTKQELSNFISQVSSQGKTPMIGFVPTMGALHEGHLSLIRLACKHADIVIASIFVNPTQFGPNEDFAKYPRDEKTDTKMLEAAGADVLFLPSVEEIYGGNVAPSVKHVTNDNILCGAFRPGHFAGVVTVVGKLFDIVQPDIAVFGEKDFQQLWILRDNFPEIEMLGAPIIREKDGLAMSSRNKYLNPFERQIAGKMNVILKNTLAKIKQGDIEPALKNAKKLLTDAGFTKIDYVELRESDTLEPTEIPGPETRIFAAAWLGKTRLIDNFPVGKLDVTAKRDA